MEVELRDLAVGCIAFIVRHNLLHWSPREDMSLQMQDLLIKSQSNVHRPLSKIHQWFRKTRIVNIPNM